ncbi:MAG: flagellar basal body rod protein FlgC [Thermodesulfobacteriota bacterium]|nr:flagellar basal body rod protein FlgC [Thermodesulfobacteriota bacterium]
MDFFETMEISSSGLSAQRARLNIIASNLANVNSTRTPEGGPYRRKDVIFGAQPLSFHEQLNSHLDKSVKLVKVVNIVEDQRPFKVEYNPSHPDADESGYVTLPNINVMEEMINMLLATRSYEANIAVISAAKNMALKALEIGR